MCHYSSGTVFIFRWLFAVPHKTEVPGLLSTGWSIRTVTCNMSLSYLKKKRLNRTFKNFIQDFLLGGLIIYHSFTLGQFLKSLKKFGIFFGNYWKVAKYRGRHTFLASFEDPSESINDKATPLHRVCWI